MLDKEQNPVLCPESWLYSRIDRLRKLRSYAIGIYTICKLKLPQIFLSLSPQHVNPVNTKSCQLLAEIEKRYVFSICNKYIFFN